ncbi:hypothetical protein ScPMuIL_011852 [Solemya velum]
MYPVILAVAFLVSVQSACPPGSCDGIICPDLVSCGARERWEPNGGGICGCCPICIRILDEGDSCEPLPLLGGTLDHQCDDHLKCHAHRRVCVLKDQV